MSILPSFSRYLRLALCSLLLLFTLLKPALSADTSSDHLRVGIYDNPPKVFMDENNRPKGIFPGIIEAVAKAEGWKIKFIPVSFKQGLKKLETGELDIMQDVAWSQSRSEIYGFTNETVMVSWGRVYQRRGEAVSTLIDLKNKRIAYMDGGIYSQGPDGLINLMQRFEIKAQLIPVESYRQVFEAIHEGRADVGVTNRLFGKTNRHHYNIENTPILISPISIRLAFSKSNPVTPQLIKTFDRHLIKLKNNENSLYYKLIDEHIRSPRKIIPGPVKWTIFGLMALTVLLAGLNILFRQQKSTASRLLKKTDKALKENERKFRTIFESLQDVYFEINLNGILTVVSPSAEKTLGTDAEDLTGKSIDRLFNSPETKQLFFQQIEQQGFIRNFEFEVKGHKDLWVSANADQFKDNRGTTSGTRGILRDISQQKATEKELLEREEKYKEMARLLPCGIIETDLELNITYVNQKGLDMFGYEPEDLDLGLNGTAFLHPDDRARPFERIQLHLANQPPPPTEYRMRTREGAELNVLWNSTPIYEDGKICGIQGSLVDLTEIKQLQKQVLRTQKLESTGILAGGIAHDFNNILLGIFGNMALAKSEISPESKAFQLIEESEKSLSRAKDLTTQLLTFAQGGEPVKQVLPIDQVIRETTAFNLSGSNIKFEMEQPQELWQVDADRGQISQVISNLVINARQAMPKGGRIRIKLENAAMSENDFASLTLDRYVKITISDEGCGISLNHLEKIFDPYFTTKPDGSGLGLAIVHSIILKHMGYIYVNSASGEGTTFVIYLPAAKITDADPEDAGFETSTGLGTLSLKILLMDDDPLVQSVSEKILNKLGHSALVCEDGDSALKAYQSAMGQDAPFDLVIIDLTIPGGMGGVDMIKSLLEIDPDARAIVASGYSTDPVMSNYQQHGFKAVISKPYTIEKMAQVIEQAFFA